MRFEWFVARRYLRSRTLVRLVTPVLTDGAGVADAGDCAVDEYGFSRNTAGPVARCYGACVANEGPGSGGIHNYDEMSAELA